MKVPIARASLCVLLAVLTALFLTACGGVFQVGIERTPTPTLSTPVPTTEPTPTPTKTPFPGQLKPGQSVKIIQIHMLDVTNGWAVGQVETDLNDHILFTTDSGQTWQDRTPQDAFLKMPPEGLAATAYFGAGGNAWVTYTSQQAPPPIQGKQVVWHTTDSGQTWQPGSIELSGFQAEYFVPANLGFLDEQSGWMMAHLGAGMSHDYIAIFTTADGGQTWQRVVDPDKNPELMACPKTGLAFSTATNGWLMGNCPGLMVNLFFYSTADGGQTWQQVNLPAPQGQPSNLFSNSSAGCGIPDLIYVSARSMLLSMRCMFYNSNKPVSWLYIGKDNGLPNGLPLPLPFGAFDFISADEGWMVGSQQNDPAASGEIYHTLDGGRNWTLVISTGWQGTPDFVNSNTGWVIAHAADKSALVVTGNGGKTWVELTSVIAR